MHFIQGAATPEPDDQVFEEDGITYRWNPSLRKFVPDNLAEAPAPAQELQAYTPEMMQFSADVEPTITLEEERVREEESAALAEKLKAAHGHKVCALGLNSPWFEFSNC